LSFACLFVQSASIFVHRHHHSMLTNSLLFTLTFHDHFPIRPLIQYNITPFNAVLPKLSHSRDTTPAPDVGFTFKSPLFSFFIPTNANCITLYVSNVAARLCIWSQCRHIVTVSCYQEYALWVARPSELTACLTVVSATSLSGNSLAKLQSGPGGESGKHSFILPP